MVKSWKTVMASVLALGLLLACGVVVTTHQYADAAGKGLVVCVKKKNRTITLAKKGKCSKGKKKKRLAGAQGPRGATGARGPQGPGTSQFTGIVAQGDTHQIAVGANIVTYGCNTSGAPWVAVENRNGSVPVRMQGFSSSSVVVPGRADRAKLDSSVGDSKVTAVSRSESTYVVGPADGALTLQLTISTINSFGYVSDVRELTIGSQYINPSGSAQCNFAGQVTA